MGQIRRNLGRIRLGLKYLAGFQPMAKDFSIRPDDVFLVGYPKSGTTWLRFLIANAVNPDQKITFANIERLVPDPRLHDDSYLKTLDAPRFFKSHNAFEPTYPRVVMIVRDPRDVLVSYHRFCVKMQKFQRSQPRSDFINAFVGGDIDVYGTWAENIGSWLGALEHDSERLFWLRYEDLSADPHHWLGKILEFLRIPNSSELIANAVAQASASTMRRLEAASMHKWKPVQDGDPNIAFVGEAKPNAWVHSLEEDEIQRINQHWKPMMERLGYSVES